MSAGNRVSAADCLRMIADTQGTQGHLEAGHCNLPAGAQHAGGHRRNVNTGAILNNMAIGYENEGNLDRA